MPQLYCGPCWTSSGQRTPATWDIESDLFCDAHKQSLGYDASEGSRIGRADAIASAAPAKAIERAMPLMSRMVRDAAAAEPAAVAAGAPKSWDEFKERKAAKSELAAAAANVPRRTNGDAGFSADPEASPGSIAHAIKKAFLPKKDKTMNERTCSVEGCDRRLMSTNKSGRCANHFYVPKAERQAAKNVSGAKRVASPAKQIPHGNGATATICVPASALES